MFLLIAIVIMFLMIPVVGNTVLSLPIPMFLQFILLILYATLFSLLITR